MPADIRSYSRRRWTDILVGGRLQASCQHRLSRAIPASFRIRPAHSRFLALDFPRKVVTIEPLLDFDLATFAGWIQRLQPEYVWLGFNSKPQSATLPELSAAKVQRLATRLLEAGIEVRGKTLRGVVLPRGKA